MTRLRTLGELLPDTSGGPGSQIPVPQIAVDSRCVQPGDVFVAVRGHQFDGHDFVDDAIRSGAAAIVAESLPNGGAKPSVPFVVVDDSATAWAQLSMALQLNSRSAPIFAGVTGTNGKTTTAWMLRSILNAAGLQTGLLGTIEVDDGRNRLPAVMTTPSSASLARHTAQMLDVGTTHAVLEVSSHALGQRRCAGLQLDTAAVTNITHDHLDYHKTVAEYRAAKARIGQLMAADRPLLINADDEGCQAVKSLLGRATISFGEANADLTAELLTRTHRSQRIRFRLLAGSVNARLKLIGPHNIANALAAAGMAEQLGIGPDAIATGLEALKCVPGRLERIDAGQPFQVLVDYAHTPDALDRVIRTLRTFAPGRLICVFGAGGNRDESKRPLMGTAASQADLSLITSDNPRQECPQQIAEQIATGFAPGSAFEFALDRREAFARAFALAEPGDVVLLAGKGHEASQQEAGQFVPFDDRKVAVEELQRTTHADPAAWQPVFAGSRSA